MSEVVICDGHGEQISDDKLRVALANLIGSRDLEGITVRQIRTELALHLGLGSDGLDAPPLSAKVNAVAPPKLCKPNTWRFLDKRGSILGHGTTRRKLA